ncbi:hypothetical protein Tco_0491156 [Tanacetum coccineum]
MAAYEVPPLPDYIPGPEVPSSPDYIPGPEEPWSPPPLDFVPEPIFTRICVPESDLEERADGIPWKDPAKFITLLIGDMDDYDDAVEDEDEEEEVEHQLRPTLST